MKLPILDDERLMVCRKELSSNKILNNDDTYYDGRGGNYYMIFSGIEEIKDYTNLKANAAYRYDIYNNKGKYIKYICLYNKNKYVEFINSILIEYQEKEIFDNKFFKVGELSSNSYLHLIYNNPNRIQFELRISNFNVDVQIDRALEIFSIATDTGSLEIFKNFIIDLFTCKIKVEYIGKKSVYIYFYNKKDDQIRKLAYNEGILSLLPIKRGKKEVFEYEPIIKN